MASSSSNAKTLFDSEDEDQVDNLKINQKYAADFQSRKQKEELRKVRFEEGEDVDCDDASDASSSSSEEDEDGNLLTTKLDVDIMKTINSLRTKDSRIYDPKTKFFDLEPDEDDSDDDDDQNESSDDQERPKKHKPKRYKDVLREQILEQIEKEEQGEEDENEDDDDDESSPALQQQDEKTARLAYDARQQELRKAFLDTTRNDSGDKEGEVSDDENFMIVKQKISANEDDEDTEEVRKEYREEMRKFEHTLSNKKSELVDPKGEVEDGEKFLLDYFKNRSWVEKDDEGNESDSQQEQQEDVTNKVSRQESSQDVDGNASDDDASLDQLDKTDDFEAQYNFRFEEATEGTTQSGADFSMISYARGGGMNTLRRKDEKRREKRLARKERKAAERKAKEEQLKRLKNAKRQEMEAKLKKVKSILGDVVEGKGGAVDEAAMMKLMEGDFDPDKFEELMRQTYGDEFYQQEDAEWKTDQDVRESLRHDEDGELIVGQDDADGGLYDNSNVEESEHDMAAAQDDDGYKDGDWPEDEEVYEEEEQPEESELEKKMRSRMTEELYKLDYEDIVADQPTRFKYRKVKPNNYGLSTEEILFARDTTLKQFVSLKQMAPYREDEYNVRGKKRRRFRELLKHDLEEQLAEANQNNPDSDKDRNAEEDKPVKKKKRRRLKKGKTKDKIKEVVSESTDAHKTNDASAEEKDNDKGKKRRRKKRKKESVIPDNSGQGEREKEHQSKPPKEEETTSEAKKEEDAPKKKRKKKRKKPSIEGISESRLASYGL